MVSAGSSPMEGRWPQPEGNELSPQNVAAAAMPRRVMTRLSPRPFCRQLGHAVVFVLFLSLSSALSSLGEKGQDFRQTADAFAGEGNQPPSRARVGKEWGSEVQSKTSLPPSLLRSTSSLNAEDEDGVRGSSPHGRNLQVGPPTYSWYRIRQSGFATRCTDSPSPSGGSGTFDDDGSSSTSTPASNCTEQLYIPMPLPFPLAPLTYFPPRRYPFLQTVSPTAVLVSGSFVSCFSNGSFQVADDDVDGNDAGYCTHVNVSTPDKVMGVSLVSTDMGKSWNALSLNNSLLMRVDTASIEWDPLAVPNATNATLNVPGPVSKAACLIGGSVMPSPDYAYGPIVYSNGVPTKSVVCWSPSMGDWVAQADLPVHMSHTAAVFWQGNVLTFGGRISLTGRELLPGATDMLAPVYIGTISSDGRGIVSWAVLHEIAPSSVRYSMSAMGLAGNRTVEGPGFIPMPGETVYLPPNFTPGIMLLGGQIVTSLSNETAVAGNASSGTDLELCAQVPTWVITDPLSTVVQFNFVAVSGSRRAEAAEKEGGEGSGSSSSAHRELEAAEHLRVKELQRRARGLGTATGTATGNSTVTIGFALFSQPVQQATWFHMPSVGLPISMSYDAGPSNTPYIFTIMGNEKKTLIGMLEPYMELVCVLVVDQVKCSTTLGSVWSNYLNIQPQESSTAVSSFSPFDSINGIAGTWAGPNNTPSLVLFSRWYVYRGYINSCNLQCPTGQYGVGCDTSPWEPVCRSCTVCRQGLEYVVSSCRTGAGSSQNRDTTCARCSACLPNETVKSYCDTDAGLDTVCMATPPDVFDAIRTASAKLTIPLLIVGPSVVGLVGIAAALLACVRGGKRSSAIAALSVAGVAAAETAAKRGADAVGAQQHALSEQALLGAAGVLEMADAHVRDMIDQLHSWQANILHAAFTFAVVACQGLWAAGMCVAVIGVAPTTGLVLEPAIAAALIAAHIVTGCILAGACARPPGRSSSNVDDSVVVKNKLGVAGKTTGSSSSSSSSSTSISVGGESSPKDSAASSSSAGLSVLGRDGSSSSRCGACACGSPCAAASCCSILRVRAALAGIVHPRLLVIGRTLTGYESGNGGRVAALRGIWMLTRDIPLVILLGVSPGTSTTSVVVLLMSSFMLFWDALALLGYALAGLRRKSAARATRNASARSSSTDVDPGQWGGSSSSPIAPPDNSTRNGAAMRQLRVARAMHIAGDSVLNGSAGVTPSAVPASAPAGAQRGGGGGVVVVRPPALPPRYAAASATAGGHGYRFAGGAVVSEAAVGGQPRAIGARRQDNSSNGGGSGSYEASASSDDVASIRHVSGESSPIAFTGENSSFDSFRGPYNGSIRPQTGRSDLPASSARSARAHKGGAGVDGRAMLTLNPVQAARDAFLMMLPDEAVYPSGYSPDDFSDDLNSSPSEHMHSVGMTNDLMRSATGVNVRSRSSPVTSATNSGSFTESDYSVAEGIHNGSTSDENISDELDSEEGNNDDQVETVMMGGKMVLVRMDADSYGVSRAALRYSAEPVSASAAGASLSPSSAPAAGARAPARSQPSGLTLQLNGGGVGDAVAVAVAVAGNVGAGGRK